MSKTNPEISPSQPSPPNDEMVTGSSQPRWFHSRRGSFFLATAPLWLGFAALIALAFSVASPTLLAAGSAATVALAGSLHIVALRRREKNLGMALPEQQAIAQNLSDGLDRVMFTLNATAHNLEKREQTIDTLTGRLKLQLERQNQDFNQLYRQVERSLDSRDSSHADRIEGLANQIQTANSTLEQNANRLLAIPTEFDNQILETLEKVGQQHTGLINKFSAVSRETIGLMESLVNRVDGRWSQLQQKLQQFDQALTTSFGQLDQQLQQKVQTGTEQMTAVLQQREQAIAVHIDAHNQQIQILNQRADEVKQSVEQAIQAFEATLEEAQRLLDQRIERLDSTGTQLSTQLGGLSEETESVATNLENLTERCQDFFAGYHHNIARLEKQTAEQMDAISLLLEQGAEQLDDKANHAIRAFKQQSQTLVEVNTILVDSIQKTGDEINHLISGISQQAADLKAQAENERQNLLSTAQQLQADSGTFFAGQRKQFEGLLELFKHIDERIHRCQNQSQTIASQLTASGQSLIETARSLGGQMKEQSADMIALMTTLTKRGNETSQQWQQAFESIDTLSQSQLHNLRAEFDTLNSVFEQKGLEAMEKIFASVSQWQQSQQTALLEQNQALEKGHELAHRYLELNAELSATAGQLTKNQQTLAELSVAFVHQNQNLAHTLVEARQHTDNAAEHLSERVHDAIGEFNNVVSILQTIHQTFQNSMSAATHLEQILTALDSRTVTAIDRKLVGWHQSVAKLASESRHAGDAIDTAVSELAERYQQLNSHSHDIVANLAHSEASAERHSLQLLRVAENLEKIHLQLLNACQSLTDSSADSTNQLADVAVSIQRPVATITRSLLEARQEVEATATLIVDKTRNFEQVIADARMLMLAIRDETTSHRQTTFLEQARYMLEQLHSISYDLTRLVLNEASSEAWRSYLRHDRSIFTRHLLSQPLTELAAALASRCQSDRETREIATSFLTTYSRMINQADQSDNLGIVTAALKTSDVGRLAKLIELALNDQNEIPSSLPATANP